MARTATEIGQIGQTTTLSNFKIVSGVAKPLDLATLGRFQGAQRAINTSLAIFRGGRVPSVPANISTDGDLGPKTLAAAQFVAKQLGLKAPELLTFASTVNNLAINATVFTSRLGTVLGFAPTTTPDPARAAPTTAPSITSPAPGALVPTVPPSSLPEPLAPPGPPEGGKKGIHWAWFVVGGLALVGGVALIFKFSKGGTKKKKELSDSDDGDFDAEDFGYGPASDDFIDV
jgi:hypothetical protein